jgi:hypothetical protein
VVGSCSSKQMRVIYRCLCNSKFVQVDVLYTNVCDLFQELKLAKFLELADTHKFWTITCYIQMPAVIGNVCMWTCYKME